EPWYQEWERSAKVKWFIALEWIYGQTLDAVFRRSAEERPDLPTLVEWFAQAAEGLAAMHDNRLVHRDGKPRNLRQTSGGRIKLMDFGIARTQDESESLRTATRHALGTPAYMSPEQLRASEAASMVGPASDVYSLCATFYELFTGERLFRHREDDAATVV